MKFATDVEIDSSHNLNLQGLPVYYGTCASEADEVKVVTCAGFTLATGAMIFVKFTHTNSLAVGSITMNVNSTGAKHVKKMNNGAVGNLRAVGEISANVPLLFAYDGTYWVLLSGADYYAANYFAQATCTTAAATAAKAAAMYYYTATAKSYVMVNFRYANSSESAITLNINSTGAKPVYINDSASSASNHTLPAGSYLAYYDGTNYHLRTDGKIPDLKMKVSITLPKSVTSYTYSNSWITADTDCYEHDLNTKTLFSTVSWAFSAGKVVFTLSPALTTAVTFTFGMLK